MKMGERLRAINIESLKPDSTKAEQMHIDIIKDMARGEIHISPTRETQTARDTKYKLGNYGITTSAENEETAGISQGGQKSYTW